MKVKRINNNNTKKKMEHVVVFISDLFHVGSSFQESIFIQQEVHGAFSNRQLRKKATFS